MNTQFNFISWPSVLAQLIPIEGQKEPKIQLHRVVLSMPYDDLLYLMPIHGKRSGFPQRYSYRDVQEMILDEEFIRVNDPDIDLRVKEDEEIEEKYIEMRDFWQKYAGDYLDNNMLAYCTKGTRKECLDEIIRSLPADKKYKRRRVEEVIRTWMQRGMSKNTFLSKYPNCGGKGKNRLFDPALADCDDNGIAESDINRIDQEMLDKILAYYQYFVKERKKTIRFAFKQLRNDLLATSVKTIHGIEFRQFDEGLDSPISEGQFRYWTSKYRDPKEEYIRKFGYLSFQANKRSLATTGDIREFGVGSRYEIDAGDVPLELVSEFNPNKNIGKPKIYYVSDAYTGEVVNCTVTLENPSWIAAFEALTTTYLGGDTLNDLLGMDILDIDAPLMGLPRNLVADLGEMHSYASSRLKQIGVDCITHTAARRPERKPFSEAPHEFVTRKNAKNLIGYIDKDKSSPKTDPKAQAGFTLKSFRKYMQACVAEANEREVDEHHLKSTLTELGITPTPINIRNYAVERLGCHLIHATEDQVDRLKTIIPILLTGTATISPKGLRYKKLFYYAAEIDPLIELHRLKKLPKSHKKHTIYYHPGLMNYVYVKLHGEFVRAEMTTKTFAQYGGLSMEEIKIIKRGAAQISKDYKKSQIPKSDLISTLKKHLEDEAIAYRNSGEPISLYRRKKDTKANRDLEKEYSRKQNATTIYQDESDPLSNKETAIPYTEFTEPVTAAETIKKETAPRRPDLDSDIMAIRAAQMQMEEDDE